MTSGPIQSRRARQTGRVVEVWRAADLGVEDEAGDWVTVCLEHGTDCHHATRKLAESWAAEPRTWCETCQQADDPAEQPDPGPAEYRSTCPDCGSQPGHPCRSWTWGTALPHAHRARHAPLPEPEEN